MTEGRRREFAAFGWAPDAVPDPQADESFERSTLQWAEREREPHASMLDWYRSLLALRRDTPDLRDPTVAVEVFSASHDDHAVAFRRGRITVAATLRKSAHVVDLGAAATPLLTSGDVVLDGSRLMLGPASVAIMAS